MLCSDALAYLIHNAGYAIVGEDLFSDFLPEEPDTLFAVQEDAASAWIPFAGTNVASTAFVQIISRCAPLQYDETVAKAMEVHLFLTRLGQRDAIVTAGSTSFTVRILGVVSNYGPSLIRRDTQDRTVFGADYMVTWSLAGELG